MTMPIKAIIAKFRVPFLSIFMRIRVLLRPCRFHEGQTGIIPTLDVDCGQPLHRFRVGAETGEGSGVSLLSILERGVNGLHDLSIWGRELLSPEWYSALRESIDRIRK